MEPGVRALRRQESVDRPVNEAEDTAVSPTPDEPPDASTEGSS